MNAIASMLRTEFYSDVSRNGRFFFSDYNKVFNDVMRVFIDQQFFDADGKALTGFQFSQEQRSNLYTLIKTITPSITTIGTITTRYGTYTQNHIDFPADFYEFISAEPVIDGYRDYSRPTSYNKKGPLMDNVFMKPTNKKTYYNEDALGLNIYRGVGGTFTQINLAYIKTPATFSVGSEANLIAAGAGVLTNGTSYIAVDDSVNNGVTYLGGTQFTATNVNLTSGTVILTANTTPLELPDNTHEILAKMAAAILLGVTNDPSKSQFVEREANKG